MRQMPMTTEMTTLHRTSPLSWHCTLSTLTSTSTESAHHERAESCSLCTFHHTHIWLKFERCPHSTHDHHHGHPCGCCLFDLTSFFPLRLPPVCLPPQRRASVIDQGHLITLKACLLSKVKRPVLKRSVWNLSTKSSVLQVDQGNLISRTTWSARTTWSVFKHVHLKTVRVSMLSSFMIDQATW